MSNTMNYCRGDRCGQSNERKEKEFTRTDDLLKLGSYSLSNGEKWASFMSKIMITGCKVESNHKKKKKN